MKARDAEALTNEYQKLVTGLQEIENMRDEDLFIANPGSLVDSLLFFRG